VFGLALVPEVVLYAIAVVYAGEKLGSLGGLAVGALLSWPLARVVTVPIRRR
jgi:hypothetical protein